MGLDRVKFHSVDSPLTGVNDYSDILFGISVDRGTKQISRYSTQIFTEQTLVTSIFFFSKINWKVKYNNSKNLQIFYD